MHLYICIFNMNERIKAIICNPKHILKCQKHDKSNWFLVINVIGLLFILLPDFHWFSVFKLFY